MKRHLSRQKVKPKEIEPLTSMFQPGYSLNQKWMSDYWESVYQHSYMGISIKSNAALREGIVIFEMSPRKMEERLNAYLIKPKEARK